MTAEFPPETRRRYKLDNGHSYFWTFRAANRTAKGRQILFLDNSGEWVPVDPVPVKLPLTHDEIFEEVEWLSAGGMHAAQMCQSIGRTAGAICRLALLENRHDIAALFYAEAHREDNL